MEITYDSLLENQKFYLLLFSIHYPFSDLDLNLFHKHLVFGEINPTKYFCDDEDDSDGYHWAELGLSFNEKIVWTSENIKFFQNKDIDFKKLPLNKNHEIGQSSFAANSLDYDSDISHLRKFEAQYYENITYEDLKIFIKIYERENYTQWIYLSMIYLPSTDFYESVLRLLKRVIEDFNVITFLGIVDAKKI